ncbi:hypothetical protein [Pseudomonas sp. IzPS59]|uniref:hypothetical protein n=1 Tax=Pseudomonas sp. IzPS59 TaxID=2774459 RepID=UPI001787B83A|nr:hypothetical protein [Pseudomonas sp. IzPS59]
MEAFLAILRIIGLFILTHILNRILSIFRSRQLYLSYQHVIDCHEVINDGYTTLITIYNKGKDKEKGIEVIFPSSSLVQILASDYSSVNSSGNKICIDRILPKGKICMHVYLDGSNKLSKKNKPFIKSEDADGKAFFGSRVPDSTGPVLLSFSFSMVVFAAFAFSLVTGNPPQYMYYQLRYPSLVSQGITPDSISQNRLISSIPFTKDDYPIAMMDPSKSKDKIITRMQVKNTLQVEIYARFSRGTNRNYINESLRTYRIEDDVARRTAFDSLREKYGLEEDDPSYVEVRIAPGQTKTLELETTVKKNTTLETLVFRLGVSGDDIDGEEIRDGYDVFIAKLPNSGIYREKLIEIKSGNYM